MSYSTAAAVRPSGGRTPDPTTPPETRMTDLPTVPDRITLTRGSLATLRRAEPAPAIAAG